MTQPLRADARRNLERVLEAAGAAFAEHGADVSVDEIARRAGVGHATVFRRFPTKDSLVAAVLLRHVARMEALARTALDREDAAAAFGEFVWRVAELRAADKSLFEGLGGRCAELPEVVEAHEALLVTIDRLVERAQAAGAVRDDVAPRDVPHLVACALDAAPRAEEDPDAWRRYVAVVLDGLRPPAARR